MPFKRHNPGCANNPEECSGCGCVFANDVFNGPASGTVAGWTQNAGAWETDGAALQTTDSNALITNDTPHPFGGISIKASADVRSDTDDDIFRVITNKEDDSNYAYAQLKVSSTCGEFSLWEVTGGVHTQLGATATIDCATLNAWHHLSVCFDICDDDSETDIYGTACFGLPKLVGHVRCANGDVYAREDTTFTGHQFGNKAALATGTITGTAKFDNFVAERVSSFVDDHCTECDISTACVIFEDDFTRVDNSTNPGDCFWTVVSGIAGISNNRMQITAANADVRCNIPYQRSVPSTELSGITRGDTVGDEAKVKVDYVDENNHHYALIKFGDGGNQATLELYSRSGGGDTQIGVTTNITANIDTDVVFNVCFIGNEIAANVGGASESALSTANGGYFTALGSGVFTGTEILFDDFVLNRAVSSLDPTCVGCDPIDSCGNCSDGEMASYYKIEIEDVTTKTGGISCDTSIGDDTWCETNINGTYFTTQNNIPSGLYQAVACRECSSGICALGGCDQVSPTSKLAINCDSGGSFRSVYAHLNINAVDTTIDIFFSNFLISAFICNISYKEAVRTIGCKDYNNTDIPPVGGFSSLCFHVDSTCTLTAINL